MVSSRRKHPKGLGTLTQTAAILPDEVTGCGHLSLETGNGAPQASAANWKVEPTMAGVHKLLREIDAQKDYRCGSGGPQGGGLQINSRRDENDKYAQQKHDHDSEPRHISLRYKNTTFVQNLARRFTAPRFAQRRQHI